MHFETVFVFEKLSGCYSAVVCIQGSTRYAIRDNGLAFDPGFWKRRRPGHSLDSESVVSMPPDFMVVFCMFNMSLNAVECMTCIGSVACKKCRVLVGTG